MYTYIDTTYIRGEIKESSNRKQNYYLCHAGDQQTQSVSTDLP